MPKSRLMPNMAALCAALVARFFARRRKKDQNTAGRLWRFAQAGLEQLRASSRNGRRAGRRRHTECAYYLCRNAMRALEGGDFGFVLQCEGDVIEAVQQAVSPKLVD